MLQLTGHTTHQLQPLDVAFLRPFRNTSTKHKRNGCVKKKLMEEQHLRRQRRVPSARPADRNVFSDHHFVPSETLEVDENVADEPTSSKGGIGEVGCRKGDGKGLGKGGGMAREVLGAFWEELCGGDGSVERHTEEIKTSSPYWLGKSMH
ncbi:hypothetical protein J437_LFUL013799 [Ladona fulva]|uniref:Uncharacterized protein n=1 Tax=Ladona fulva TaxID=123851 RepID=A0A8K0P5V1_LADFU|nr:hypothetical protein J437_LFUL013799 [Ladona fulva]